MSLFRDNEVVRLKRAFWADPPDDDRYPRLMPRGEVGTVIAVHGGSYMVEFDPYRDGRGYTTEVWAEYLEAVG